MGCHSPSRTEVPRTQDALSRHPHFCYYVGTPDLLECRGKEKASYILTFKEQEYSSPSSSKVLVLLDGFDKTRTFCPDVNDTLGVEFHWRDLTRDLPFVKPPRIYFVFDLCESSRQRFLPSLMPLLSMALGPQTVPSSLDYALSADYLAALNAIEVDPTGKGDLAASFVSLALELPPHLSPLHPGPDSAVIRELLLVLADRTAVSLLGWLNRPARQPVAQHFIELVKILASSGGPPPPPPERNNSNKTMSIIPWYRDWIPKSWSTEHPLSFDVEAVLIHSRWRSPRFFGWELLRMDHEMQPLKTLLDAFKEVGYLDTQEGKIETLMSLAEGQGTDPLQPWESRPREVGLVVEAIRYALALSSSTTTTTTATPTTTTTPPSSPPSLRDALTKLDRLKILPRAAQNRGNKELLAWLLDDADKKGGSLREALNTANYIQGPSPTNRNKQVWLRNYVLHTAICCGDAEMVKFLLERGAKMLLNNEGRTPLAFARVLVGSRYTFPGIKEKVEVLEGWLRERGLDSEYWDEPEEYALDASEGFEFEIPAQ
ncbi:hypothetical protein B0T20DRAFT_461224 [Sordaria brevicollis]|uniref:Uncharacterized protein n=1 Tax=Sordaria brevicollis TaxID=83679 RepID=A0AAE0UCB9_SORBR|nr:hypothetical protein B0T20DRAFT_461224 [Sordaria brevicollis]